MSSFKRVLQGLASRGPDLSPLVDVIVLFQICRCSPRLHCANLFQLSALCCCGSESLGVVLNGLLIRCCFSERCLLLFLANFKDGMEVMDLVLSGCGGHEEGSEGTAPEDGKKGRVAVQAPLDHSTGLGHSSNAVKDTTRQTTHAHSPERVGPNVSPHVGNGSDILLG